MHSCTQTGLGVESGLMCKVGSTAPWSWWNEHACFPHGRAEMNYFRDTVEKCSYGPAQLAEAMQISRAEVDDLLGCELRSVTVSLQGIVKSKSDPSELVDVLPSEELPPMEQAEIDERTASAWTLLDRSNLTPKERTVVMLRFGLDGSNEWRTLAEVARHMGCSRRGAVV